MECTGAQKIAVIRPECPGHEETTVLLFTHTGVFPAERRQRRRDGKNGCPRRRREAWEGGLMLDFVAPLQRRPRPRGMNQTDRKPRVSRLPRRRHQVMDLAALGCLNSIIFRISIWTWALYGPPGPVGGP